VVIRRDRDRAYRTAQEELRVPPREGIWVAFRRNKTDNMAFFFEFEASHSSSYLVLAFVRLLASAARQTGAACLRVHCVGPSTQGLEGRSMSVLKSAFPQLFPLNNFFPSTFPGGTSIVDIYRPVEVGTLCMAFCDHVLSRRELRRVRL
jgi:hypothetical protein